MGSIFFSSPQLKHLGLIFFAVLLLPIMVLLPYLFFDGTMQVLHWAWEENYLPFWLPLIFSLVGGLFSFFLLSKFFNLGFYLYSFVALVLTVGSAMLSMLEQRHLSLVVIFLFTCLLVFIREQLRKILHKEFYDPRVKFWEAHPKAIPGIEVKVNVHEKEESSSNIFLSNLGKEGCFLFRKEGSWEQAPSSIHIQFNERNGMQLKVKPTLYARNKKGIGLRFVDLKSKENSFYNQLSKLRRIGHA